MLDREKEIARIASEELTISLKKYAPEWMRCEQVRRIMQTTIYAAAKRIVDTENR